MIDFSGPSLLLPHLGDIFGVSTSFTTIFNGVLFLSCFAIFVCLLSPRVRFLLQRIASSGIWGVEGNRNTQGHSQEARIYRFSFFGRCATIPLAALWYRILRLLFSLFLRFCRSFLHLPVLIYLSLRNRKNQKIILFQELLMTLIVFDQLELLAQNLSAFCRTSQPT